MNFLELIALFLVILILIVIVNNIFLYGRDLAKYPKKTEKDIERDIRHYYPGSPDDEYETDYDSDSDSDDENTHKPRPNHKKQYNLKPQHIADYVSSHIN